MNSLKSSWFIFDACITGHTAYSVARTEMKGYYAMKQWYEELFENYGMKYDNECYTQGTMGECDFIEKEKLNECRASISPLNLKGIIFAESACVLY
jgi:hypothetical protein